MEILHNLAFGFEHALTLQNLMFCALGCVVGTLIGFALISEYVNMILGIIFMVFVAALAGTNYSVVRNVKIAGALIAVAFVFQKGLGLQLPLY